MTSGTVCLTFDFDALSRWIAWGLASPGPLSRGEFGAVAVPRILRLLSGHDIPATFYTPGHTAETYPDLVRQIADAGHELALHGYCHEPVSELSEAQEREVLLRSADILEKLTGQRPSGCRTPSWDFTEHTVGLMAELGLSHDSSLMGHDYLPYPARTGDRWPAGEPYRFGSPTGIVEVPVSWTLDDFPAFEFIRTEQLVMPGLRRPGEVFANWLDDVRYMLTEYQDGVCVLTFHPQAIGRGHRMIALRQLIAELKDLGVRFARVDTVAEAWRQGRHRR
ncbi:polysaccharide deacetylase family protein [Amycolatopsis jejuensis]|uniref:polysaccharide deacetylase family protein n=1 Tax=Amycolatopsis jejuensis TaxID=330084 RepID=UPI000524CF7A|nr:polysaccharide deacetylase [Amycolatopsis jejuensis]